MESNDTVYYRVWGIDNVSYGPVELPALVSWIKSGRVQPETWVFRQDERVWSRAADFTELKGLFKSKGSGATSSPLPGIKPNALRRIRIFADMDERQLESLATYMEVIKVPAFTHLVRRGDHGDAMYMVLEGELRASVIADGKETILSTMAVGEAFGELALIDHGPRSADVIANVESVVLKISASKLEHLFKEAPALAAPFLYGLSRAIAARVRHLTKRYEDSMAFARAAQ